MHTKTSSCSCGTSLGNAAFDRRRLEGAILPKTSTLEVESPHPRGGLACPPAAAMALDPAVEVTPEAHTLAVENSLVEEVTPEAHTLAVENSLVEEPRRGNFGGGREFAEGRMLRAADCPCELAIKCGSRYPSYVYADGILRAAHPRGGVDTLAVDSSASQGWLPIAALGAQTIVLVDDIEEEAALDEQADDTRADDTALPASHLSESERAAWSDFL